MLLGEKLKALRKNKHGLTLSEVSEKANLSVSFLSDVERGRTKPSLDTLEKLANFYQVPMSELVEVNDDRPPLSDKDLMPKGLQELIKEDGELEPDIVDIMLRMEHRAKIKPETKEQWRNYYHSLKWMMGR
ncbi:MAG: helix-turn-helix transcriptional regulator [Anaerolineaceae bacterium]|nr:helix-turn-helix transcriptional regulator [Anaerolineaceae bacterium]